MRPQAEESRSFARAQDDDRVPSSLIVERVKSGMRRAAEKGTRSGKAIGRLTVPKHKRTAILAAYARTQSLRKVAKRFGVSASTVRNVRRASLRSN